MLINNRIVVSVLVALVVLGSLYVGASAFAAMGRIAAAGSPTLTATHTERVRDRDVSRYLTAEQSAAYDGHNLRFLLAVLAPIMTALLVGILWRLRAARRTQRE